jgi:hypothetical protein
VPRPGRVATLKGSARVPWPHREGWQDQSTDETIAPLLAWNRADHARHLGRNGDLRPPIRGRRIGLVTQVMPMGVFGTMLVGFGLGQVPHNVDADDLAVARSPHSG